MLCSLLPHKVATVMTSESIPLCTGRLILGLASPTLTLSIPTRTEKAEEKQQQAHLAESGMEGKVPPTSCAISSILLTRPHFLTARVNRLASRRLHR